MVVEGKERTCLYPPLTFVYMEESKQHVIGHASIGASPLSTAGQAWYSPQARVFDREPTGGRAATIAHPQKTSRSQRAADCAGEDMGRAEG